VFCEIKQYQEPQLDVRFVIHDELSDDSLLPEVVKLPELTSNRSQPERFLQKTPQEHLREARQALAEGFKPHKNPMKAIWGRVSDARIHLNAINKRSKEYKEAQELLKEVQSRMEEMEKVSLTLTRHLMIKQREMVGEEFEFYCLAKNLDARVVLTGSDKSHLRIECTLFGETFIQRMVQDSDLLLHLERAGFKKVTLGDGGHIVWTHTFEPV